MLSPATATVARTEPGSANASEALLEVRVAAVKEAAKDTKLYELRAADGEVLPAAEPGAHIDVHLPNGKTRQYSLTVSEANPERYLIGVRRDPASRGGSSYMHDEVKPGDILKIRLPRNHFPLVENAPHVVLIAGGIGITPIYCMVQRLAALGRAFALHYSCRSRADMAFRAELEKCEEAHLHFDDESGGKFLDIAAIVAAAPKDAHLYCCGPMPMLKAFEQATAQWPRAQIHAEYFAPKQEPAKAGGFVVELARSGQEFAVPEGQTILQVLLDNGIYVDHSCELGICGLCQTTLLSGTPEHRDAFLTDEQKEANDAVMICCAGCQGDRLVLDL
jgi:tetrachlorobenzoquinone reductase